MDRLDALVLPILAAVIVIYVLVVWGVWFRNKSDRALNFFDDANDPKKEPGSRP
jgi:hypothetical protein